ncbi:MAG: CPBP family intramembrane metalloprotease [Anaerolineales bacterium]|nr:CPBP family intramembrane metalloprotease [Anaerolineales bacterium]
MKLRTWLLSDIGVITTGIILTLIVLAESIFPLWAPYFIFYAILAISIPLTLQTYQFGRFWTVLRTYWRVTLGIFVVAVIWDKGVTTWLYDRILVELGVGGDPFYSLSAATEVLAETAALKFGITPDAALMLYALFILVWAPLGEELFYRGYMQGVLRRSRNFKVAALVSAAFFGVRHATHLFFLWPQVPLVAAGSWVLSAFVFGLLMSYLYEKARSLYPLILVHAGVNLIGIMLSV